MVRPEVSGLDAPRHADEVRRHAIKLGYELVYMVRPPQDHAGPVGYALGIAAGLGADVVVVYDLAAVDHSPARVCELFDLETVVPPETWVRVHESCSGAEDVRPMMCAVETV
ncbi:hypothetical protein [Nocardia miyunensis]|uniref:hypothetical protein n=1 Tax=Nocardia miyunensis TaxID=282684 RepID=UPI000A62936F|nr:hypothetical protein [Nocardia miyunensis]